MTLSLIFFGSFQSYSVQVLDRLAKQFTVSAIVTTPPAPNPPENTSMPGKSSAPTASSPGKNLT